MRDCQSKTEITRVQYCLNVTAIVPIFKLISINYSPALPKVIASTN